MQTVIIGTLIGLAFVFLRLKEARKNQNKISEITKSIKFSCLDYSRTMLMIMAGFTIFPICMLVYSISNTDMTMIAFTVATILLFAGELINIKQVFKFYYNDNSCIINGEIVRYKSIKAVYPRVGNPLGRYTLVTFNGDKLNIFKQPLQIILEITNLKVTLKETSK